MKKRTRTKMIMVPFETKIEESVETMIEDPCLGRAFSGPKMEVWAFGFDDGVVQFNFRHPQNHPKLKFGDSTEFEVQAGESPNVVLMWATLGFSVEREELLSFLRRVAVVFELSWEIEDVSASSFPPPRHSTSQPPALVN
jgi:hypothetical protein